MRVLVATTNRHKAREIAAILAPFGIEVASAQKLPSVVEDGTTFEENATLKARSAAAVTGHVALADDSGIVLPALAGAPGVRSARYAGPEATDAENNAKLLAELAKRGLSEAPASFVCAAVVAGADGRLIARAIGHVEGIVRGPPLGEAGFGYDPLFHFVGPGHPAPGVRFAQMTPAQKDAVSHRGKAFRAIGEILSAVSRAGP